MDGEKIFLNSDSNNYNTNNNDIIQINYSKNNKINIQQEIFILNNTNTVNYKYSNPDVLLIINTSFTYSETFLQAIIKGGVKPNV